MIEHYLDMDLARIEARLGLSFNDKNLLAEAFTHRSSLTGNRKNRPVSNERLEFLGDAVLQLCISDILLRRHPDKSEGELTRIRSSLVNEGTLAAIASRRRIGQFLRLGKGEDTAGGRIKRSILANTLESLTGAVYLDQGYDRACEWVGMMFSAALKTHIARPLYPDHKTRLQELSQKTLGLLPRYELVETSGPEHAKTFLVCVSLGESLRRRGIGKSIKTAEMAAAERALRALEKSNTSKKVRIR